jgi:D-alanyl-D-alanine carboxypeptidase
MNVEARRLGTELRPTGSRSSYRDFATQQQMWNDPRYNAARPGTSNHGWGNAVDVPTVQMRQMIARIGARYGWRQQGSRDWWHHERFNPGAYTGSDPGPAGTATPTPPAPAPQLEDEAVMTSEVAASGAFHVWMVGPQRRSVWFTVQPGNSTAWGGARPGHGPAGWSKFWDAPSGRTIRAITASRSQGGSLHFWATLDNGDTSYAFQRPNESEWRGGSGSSRLGAFAPAP